MTTRHGWRPMLKTATRERCLVESLLQKFGLRTKLGKVIK